MQSKMSWLILFTIDRSFQIESSSFLTTFETWEKPDLFNPFVLSAKKGTSGSIVMTYLIWRGHGSSPRPPAFGANTYSSPEPPSNILCIDWIFYCVSLSLLLSYDAMRFANCRVTHSHTQYMSYWWFLNVT